MGHSRFRCYNRVAYILVPLFSLLSRSELRTLPAGWTVVHNNIDLFYGRTCRACDRTGQANCAFGSRWLRTIQCEIRHEGISQLREQKVSHIDSDFACYRWKQRQYARGGRAIQKNKGLYTCVSSLFLRGYSTFSPQKDQYCYVQPSNQYKAKNEVQEKEVPQL